MNSHKSIVKSYFKDSSGQVGIVGSQVIFWTQETPAIGKFDLEKLKAEHPEKIETVREIREQNSGTWLVTDKYGMHADDSVIINSMIKKRFIEISQTYSMIAIMNVDEGETEESVTKRVRAHCERNGGAEAVIVSDGSLTCHIATGIPTQEDESIYECID
jgi:hypothetical protein